MKEIKEPDTLLVVSRLRKNIDMLLKDRDIDRRQIKDLEHQCNLFEKELNDTINGYQNTIQILSSSANDNNDEGIELEAIDNYVDNDIKDIVEPPKIKKEKTSYETNKNESDNQTNLNKIYEEKLNQLDKQNKMLSS